jgi:hypothetical protein
MKVRVEVDNLTDEQWEVIGKVLRTEYPIRENMLVVCVVIAHGEEERHVQMPVNVLAHLLSGLHWVTQ